MITKAVRQHGSRVRGVVEYLFGPGRAEEHTNPHVVAAHAAMWVGETAKAKMARRDLADELDFHRVALAPEVTERFVFHAAVSEQLCDGVDELLAASSPAEAPETWTQRFVAHVGRKRGMATALKQAVADAASPEAAQTHADVIAASKERMRVAITTLVEAGVADGTLRSDVEPMDLLRSISGVCLADTGSAQSARMVSLLTDGMRYGATRP